MYEGKVEVGGKPVSPECVAEARGQSVFANIRHLAPRVAQKSSKFVESEWKKNGVKRWCCLAKPSAGSQLFLMSLYPSSSKAPPPPGKTEFEILKASHKSVSDLRKV